MSWISVDQKLIGGKLRDLRKAMHSSRNEAIGVLIGLWLWGMDNATPDGTLRGCDREDLAEQIALGLDKRYDPVDVVSALIENSWVDEGADGSLKIHDWDEWRKEYNDYMERRRKNRERVQKHREKTATEEAQEEAPNKPANIAATAAITAPEHPKEEEPSSAPKLAAYPADFETFWKAYPRHDEKGNANKKYQARIKDGFSPAELLKAAENYAEQCRKNHTEQTYVKQAKTFLSDSTPFVDYLPKGEEQITRRGANENPFL